MVDGWLNRPRGTEPARPDLCAQRSRVPDARATDALVLEECVIIRSRGEDGRRSVGDQQPGVSGPSSGAHALRLHLVMIPPGTRSTPHVHAGSETAVYVISGEADVWHGPGLGKRSAVRAGDFIYVPPGAPHLAVNRGEVTSIAVVGRTDTPDQPGFVVIELPRHLAGLASYPVASGNELSPPPQTFAGTR
jgi:uncharacterized RmlC-like cupin family protein